jgi:hypothetical protein
LRTLAPRTADFELALFREGRTANLTGISWLQVLKARAVIVVVRGLTKSRAQALTLRGLRRN